MSCGLGDAHRLLVAEAAEHWYMPTLELEHATSRGRETAHAQLSGGWVRLLRPLIDSCYGIQVASL